jgi:predicted ATPase
LTKLIENDLLYLRGRPPRAKYFFKHALVHEAAYRSLLRKTRRKYHQAAAELIEEQFPLLAQTEPEIVAHHYSAAGSLEQAIRFWHLAGDRARYRSANMEAIAHLTKALDALSTLPQTTERTEKELDLLLALGPALIAIKGYAAHEVERIYSRARTLCRKMGKKSQLFQTQWGLWGFYLVRAKHKKAHAVGRELLELAKDSQDPIYRIESHLTIGSALYCLAKFAQAKEHLEQGTALYDPNQHRSHTSLFAADLGVFCTVWSSHPLWHVGYPDRARINSDAAVRFAEEFAHPFSSALALNYSAIFHQFRREAEPARQRAEAAIHICKDHKFSYYLGWAMIIKGWANAELGECKKGIKAIKQGLDIMRDTGAQRSLPYYLSLLAAAYYKDRRPDKGLHIISTAFKEANQIEEYWWKAELWRLKGNLLLQQSQLNVTKAKDSFLNALNIARHQGSLMLELRAATSLHRLGRQQALDDEKSGLLGDVYNRFTEGFDTYDLVNAKGLIDEMQAPIEIGY